MKQNHNPLVATRLKHIIAAWNKYIENFGDTDKPKAEKDDRPWEAQVADILFIELHAYMVFKIQNLQVIRTEVMNWIKDTLIKVESECNVTFSNFNKQELYLEGFKWTAQLEGEFELTQLELTETISLLNKNIVKFNKEIEQLKIKFMKETILIKKTQINGDIVKREGAISKFRESIKELEVKIVKENNEDEETH